MYRNLRRLFVFRLSVFCIWFVLCQFTCYADIYTYMDDSGTVCMTNSLGAVPKKFRKSMRVVKEERPKTQKQPQAVGNSVPQAAPPEADASQPASVTMHKQDKYKKTGFVVGGFILLWYLLTKLPQGVGYQRTASVLLLFGALLSSVYLYRLYVEQMTAVYHELRTNALNIKKNVETREQKTGKTIDETERTDGQAFGKPAASTTSGN